MRPMLTSIALVLLASGAAPAQSQSVLSSADSAQILEAMENWEEGWRERNAELAACDYAEDADWTNAFGMRRIGRAQIQSLLEYGFGLDFVMAGETEYQYHDLRLVGEGVALLRSRSIRTGQQFSDGTIMAPRRVNHLRVFVKRDGRWLITSHLIGDERTPGEPR